MCLHTLVASISASGSRGLSWTSVKPPSLLLSSHKLIQASSDFIPDLPWDRASCLPGSDPSPFSYHVRRRGREGNLERQWNTGVGQWGAPLEGCNCSFTTQKLWQLGGSFGKSYFKLKQYHWCSEWLMPKGDGLCHRQLSQRRLLMAMGKECIPWPEEEETEFRSYPC